MSDLSKAWVWDSYQGVVQDNCAKGPTPKTTKDSTEDRVVRFRTIQNSRSEAMGQNSTGARTRFGLTIAVSILVGAFFPLIAFLLFLVAALLIASGKEAQKTEDFLASLPGGDYVIKALARVDGWLS